MNKNDDMKIPDDCKRLQREFQIANRNQWGNTATALILLIFAFMGFSLAIYAFSSTNPLFSLPCGLFMAAAVFRGYRIVKDSTNLDRMEEIAVELDSMCSECGICDEDDVEGK